MSGVLEAANGTNRASVPAPPRPASFPSGSGGGMDEEIPPEIFDQIRESEMASGGGGTSSRIRICQYCTVENTHDGTDCEVCGLPL
jgi:nuclear protein localization family protein 4